MSGSNNAINAPLPLSATQGGLGLASPTAHGVLIGEGASAVTPIVLAAGEILIGTTAGDPARASVTASGGISVSNTSGAIAFTGSGTGLTWVDQTTASVTMAVNRAYICDDTSNLITLTLPAVAALGAMFVVVGKGSGLWTVAQQASQYINFGNITTTVGAGGYLSSTNANDCVLLVCTTVNVGFTVFSSIGNITYN